MLWQRGKAYSQASAALMSPRFFLCCRHDGRNCHAGRRRFLGALRGGLAYTAHRPGWRSASRACSRSLQPVRSAIFRTGRLLAPSMPVSSSARPALPPQP